MINDAELSDGALKIWLVLGMHPRVLQPEGYALPAWWIAQHAGWSASATAQARTATAGPARTDEKRVQRGTVELVGAGLIEVTRQPIGGGHSRPVYRRLGEAGQRNKEWVTRREVASLSPALLRSWLRWLQIMGHRHQTRLPLGQLADRWGMTHKQARRQRDDLITAGLLSIDADGTVRSARSKPAAELSTGSGDRGGTGTFLSLSGHGGRDIFVAPIDKNYIPEDLHTPVGTNVPSLQTPSRAPRDTGQHHPPAAAASQPSASQDATPEEVSRPRLTAPKAAQTPPPRSDAPKDPAAGDPHTPQPAAADGPPADEALVQARRIVTSVPWLRQAPQQVRWQACSVLAGRLRRIRHGITAGDLIAALRKRVLPEDVEDRHCQIIHAVIAGLYADAISQPDKQRPARSTRLLPSTAPSPVAAGQRPGRQTLEQLKTTPLPPEPKWDDPLDDTDPWSWLLVFFARRCETRRSDAPSLLAMVRRCLPARYHDLAAAAARYVRELPEALTPDEPSAAQHAEVQPANDGHLPTDKTPVEAAPLGALTWLPGQDHTQDQGEGQGMDRGENHGMGPFGRLDSESAVPLDAGDPRSTPDTTDSSDPDSSQIPDADQIGSSTMKPTSEQQDAIQAFMTGQDLVVSAGAGTGKTSTLRLMADQPRHGRAGLYVAFSKAIADEARRSFPATVQARTAHSLAFGWARHHCPATLDRLGGRAPWQQVAAAINTEPVQVVTEADSVRLFDQATVTRWVLDMVRRFCQSSATSLRADHMPPVVGLSETSRRQTGAQLLPFANKLWLDLTAPVGSAAVGHDVYLKLWGLSRPTLSAECIWFDEAQDASPVIADVVLAQQQAQRIFVGDENQAIFGFTGAVNAMAGFNAPHRLALTQSWRFGEPIAAAANAALSALNADLRLRGNPDRTSTVADRDAGDRPQHHNRGAGTPEAVLCRGNTATIAAVLQAHRDGRAVHLLGGTQTARRFVDGAQQLITAGRTGHPDLVAFTSWEQAREYAEHDPRGGELSALVRLVDTYGTQVLVDALDRCVSTEDRAQTVVATVHKAKGREWDSVSVDPDFDLEPALCGLRAGTAAHPTSRSLSVPDARAELMLAYVALTRARTHLDPGRLCQQLLDDGPAAAAHSSEARTLNPTPDPTRGWGHDVLGVGTAGESGSTTSTPVATGLPDDHGQTRHPPEKDSAVVAAGDHCTIRAGADHRYTLELSPFAYDQLGRLDQAQLARWWRAIGATIDAQVTDVTTGSTTADPQTRARLEVAHAS